MSLRTAHGGYVKQPGYNAFPVGSWTGNWRVRDAEVTQSDSGGCTLYFAVVQDNEWSFECPRDDTNYPEAVGWTPGTILATVYFKLGADLPNNPSKGDKLVNTLVTGVTPVCDNKGDVVKVTVHGKGGLLTPSQTVL